MEKIMYVNSPFMDEQFEIFKISFTYDLFIFKNSSDQYPYGHFFVSHQFSEMLLWAMWNNSAPILTESVLPGFSLSVSSNSLRPGVCDWEEYLKW